MDGGDWSYAYGSGGGMGDYYYSDDGNTYYYSDDGYDYLLDGGYTTYTYGSGGGYGGGSGSGIVWDGCTNDDSIGDEYDDTCSEYYDTNPDECGNYDTEDFVAADLCCACYGTSYTTTYSYGSGGGDGGYGYYEGCTNDDSIGDEYDDTCSAYYDENP